MNGQVELTWQTLQTIIHSFFGARTCIWLIYIFFTNVHDWSHISGSTNKTLGKWVLWNNYAAQTVKWQKPSVSNLRVLFCPCVVQNSTAHIDWRALNMRHQSQKGFRGIFFGILQHQKGYLIYIPSTWKIVSSHDVVFYKTFYSALEYTSYPYS